jgi:hypothetical protein
MPTQIYTYPSTRANTHTCICTCHNLKQNKEKTLNRIIYFIIQKAEKTDNMTTNLVLFTLWQYAQFSSYRGVASPLSELSTTTSGLIANTLDLNHNYGATCCCLTDHMVIGHT